MLRKALMMTPSARPFGIGDKSRPTPQIAHLPSAAENGQLPGWHGARSLRTSWMPTVGPFRLPNTIPNLQTALKNHPKRPRNSTLKFTAARLRSRWQPLGASPSGIGFELRKMLRKALMMTPSARPFESESEGVRRPRSPIYRPRPKTGRCPASTVDVGHRGRRP